MSFHYLVNYAVGSGSSDLGVGHMYNFYDMLTSHGWTCKWAYFYDSSTSSWTSDITKLDSKDDLVTRSNTAPWIVLEDPNGVQLLMHRFDNYSWKWRFAMSPAGSYSDTGSDTAPTATDEQVLIENCDTFANTTATYGAICVEDTDPYQFYMISWNQGDSNYALQSCFIRSYLDISHDSGIPDNYVYTIQYRANNMLTDFHTKGITTSTSYSRNVAMVNSSDYNTVSALSYYGGGKVVVPRQINVDSAGNDLLFPIAFGRSDSFTSPNGWCGITSFIMFTGRSLNSGDTIDSESRAVFGDVAVLWDGSSSPLY